MPEGQPEDVAEMTAIIEKVKPKRKAAAKKVIASEPEPVIEPVSEVVVTPAVEEKVEAPVSKDDGKSIKTVELVECPDCKKKMTAKSLRYSHKKNCVSNESVATPKPKAVRPKSAPEREVVAPEPTALTQHQYDRHLKQQRKIEKYQSLVAKAF